MWIDPARWSRQARALGAVLVLVSMTIAVRLPLLTEHQPIDDEVNYSVIARAVMGGGQPYADAVERRPPLTFWIYEACFRLFGSGNWLALE